MDLASISIFATALFTITNPIGNTALFASMTSALDARAQARTAGHSALAITIILLLVLWAGQYLLRFFGINIPALETAGGIIVLSLGLSMLHSEKSRQAHSAEESSAALEKDSIAVVPMAIPIVAGPGAISTVLINSSKLEGEWATMLGLSAVCLGYGLLFWLCFRSASRISAVIGVHGVAIITRIMGMILAAIAVLMITSGLKQLLPGLA